MGVYGYSLLALSLMLMLAVGTSGADTTSPEQRLHDSYIAAQKADRFRQFPFYIRSRQQGDILEADVLARLDIDYQRFHKRLKTARNWCEFLILNLNVKTCVSDPHNGQHYVVVYIGRKEYQPPEITYQMRYLYQVEADRPAYMEATLTADKGPMLTRHYQVRIEAAPMAGKTLLHMQMHYETSMLSRAATFTYLKTLGRNKIGFTITGRETDGSPIYSRGLRAIIERNVMRYYLGMQVYLSGPELGSRRIFPTAFGRWFDATERYHKQLYEYDKHSYLDAKRQEYLNQMELQQKLDSGLGGVPEIR